MISYDKLFRRLAERGYTSYKIRQDKVIGQGTLTRLKAGTGGIDAGTLNKLCRLLSCQPGDLMEYIPDSDPAPDPTITI